MKGLIIKYIVTQLVLQPISHHSFPRLSERTRFIAGAVVVIVSLAAIIIGMTFGLAVPPEEDGGSPPGPFPPDGEPYVYDGDRHGPFPPDGAPYSDNGDRDSLRQYAEKPDLYPDGPSEPRVPGNSNYAMYYGVLGGGGEEGGVTKVFSQQIAPSCHNIARYIIL